MLCVQHDDIRPDMVLLGKAISGGLLPVSVVLADKHIMEVLRPGQHGSTYGGSPLAAKVASEALGVLVDEKLSANASRMETVLKNELTLLKEDAPWVKAIRGKGLLWAIEIDEDPDGNAAWNICIQFARQGLLAKPTRGNIIRLAPPLVITETELLDALEIIKQGIMMHEAIA
ncbi:MAG: aminotransferase class III-fold pyridoxal phosphate-dependent enzyme, partial [Saprospiraceae bacterium]